MSYDTTVYSKKKDGNVKLSKNFTLFEFGCKDGSDIVIVNPALVNLLQTIRDHFGVPVTINSAYRTVAYNSKVSGSSSESQHCMGNACDIVVEGISPSVVADYCEKIMPYTGGIGRFSTFTHADVRSVKARWRG